MGDPLSVTASAASLLSLGLQSTEYLYNYYRACRDQHQDLAQIADQLGDLLESLQSINKVLGTRTRRPHEQSLIQSVERSIAGSEDVIRSLQDEADKFKKEPVDNLKKKAIVIGRRAAYPFKRSTLEDLGDDVGNFLGNLSLALQALQLKEHQNTQNDIEAFTTIFKKIREQKVSTDLQQWLRPPDVTINLNIASAKRHPGTGQWLVQGPAYTAWLQQDNSFLWLYGFAGCGKSVLCSTAIQHAFRRGQSTAVAFFFFTFNDESKQDASATLRALLFQLCWQIPGLEVDLARLKESYRHGTPPVSILQEVLRHALTRCRHVCILLDALDESPDSSRAEVLSMIEAIRQWQLAGLHLLVTSRDTPDIRDRLQSPTLNPSVQYIVLKNDNIQQDISRYISYQLDHDHQLQRWGHHRERIEGYLTQHAGGVFHWVECQLESLRQCPHSEKHLQKCLDALPKSLDETYERILCGMKFPQEAQQILSLLCYASRPLSVNEVTDALAIDIDDLECYDPSSKFEAGADDLSRICPGLIEICLRSCTHNDTEDNTNKSGSSIHIVQVAHFSVQEYLLSDQIRMGQAADFALSGGSQHGRISKRCLLYFEYHDFLQQTLTPNLVKQYAFARYAAEYWPHHYHQAESHQQLSKRVVFLLTTHLRMERWIRLYNPDRPQDTDVNYHGSVQNCPSATYYASVLGLHDVLADILHISTVDVNVQGGAYGTPLQAASRGGHEKVVQMLLDAGADVNAQGGRYRNALRAASLSGYEKVVQMLLDAGVNVDSHEERYTLQEASRNGHERVVQMLLNAGVEINSQDGCCGDALRETRWDSLGHIMWNFSIPFDSEGWCGNALEAASEGGHSKVVQKLLKAGAEVNARGGYYGNALQTAAAGGHQEVVRMLLDKGADVNALGFYANALQAAAEGGHTLMVQTLLDNGADVNAQGGMYGNALQAASQGGHTLVVQMLLEKGADVSAQRGHYSNALQAASQGGHLQIVQMLRKNGAKHEVVDEIDM